MNCTHNIRNNDIFLVLEQLYIHGLRVHENKRISRSAGGINEGHEHAACSALQHVLFHSVRMLRLQAKCTAGVGANVNTVKSSLREVHQQHVRSQCLLEHDSLFGLHCGLKDVVSNADQIFKGAGRQSTTTTEAQTAEASIFMIERISQAYNKNPKQVHGSWNGLGEFSRKA